MSEALDAEELHALVGKVFDVIDRIVVDHGGTVHRHVGDEVMALFGAPIAYGDDPLRAVRAGFETHRAVADLGTKLGRELAVHIGISSGEVVAGKFYGTDRDSQAAIARVSGTVAWKCNATVTRDIEQEDGSTVSTVCVGAAEFATSDMDAVKAAVAAHVAAAYAREAELMAAINAADSVTALRAIDLTAGWAAVPPSDPGA